MTDRVHPGNSPPQTTDNHPQIPAKSTPVPQPGTYVIQIPKDQVCRVPPPENAKRFQNLSRRKSRGGCCGRCCCCFLGLIITLLLIAAIAAGVIYFVFKPEAPKYSIDSVAIKGFNLTSGNPFSPEFDVTVRANNPNDKIGIYYRSGSSVDVYYNAVKLCNGQLPAFYQGTNNVTVFTTALKGADVELSSGLRSQIANSVSKKAVPFHVKLRAPVKIKVGSVKTWEITVKVDCDLTVDKLTANAKIVSKDCDYGVKLW